jgi:indole-3-glycerol phosphate synthase
MRQTNTILDEILKKKQETLAKKKQQKSVAKLKQILKKNSDQQKLGSKTNVKEILRKQSGTGVNLIAEIKKSSPSAGTIRSDFNLRKIAEIYQASEHVKAISVITEKDFFQGDLDYIKTVKSTSDKPVLRKDFIVDEYQVYESKLIGADAILLIVKALHEEELVRLYDLCRELSLDVLVEVHDKYELEAAVSLNAGIIGVNSRNLNNFEINRDLFSDLFELIPTNVIKVAESGLHSHLDVMNAKRAGADAILVGTKIMKAKEIKSTISHLIEGKD